MRRLRNATKIPRAKAFRVSGSGYKTYVGLRVQDIRLPWGLGFRAQDIKLTWGLGLRAQDIKLTWGLGLRVQGIKLTWGLGFSGCVKGYKEKKMLGLTLPPPARDSNSSKNC